MMAEIYYDGKQGCSDWYPRKISVISERAALAYATRHWTHGCGGIVVYVNGTRRERRYWSSGHRWGLYGWDK
jgi:hypothetical protein